MTVMFSSSSLQQAQAQGQGFLVVVAQYFLCTWSCTCQAKRQHRKRALKVALLFSKSDPRPGKFETQLNIAKKRLFYPLLTRASLVVSSCSEAMFGKVRALAALSFAESSKRHHFPRFLARVFKTDATRRQKVLSVDFVPNSAPNNLG